MKATILLPTTGDRGPVLPHAVDSVRRQTVDDWELFLVGDGADDDTRSTAENLAASDPRIRWFDFPKDSSRGELNRHQLLTTEARGEIVCYLSDRDLYLDSHLARMHEELQRVDFTHSLPARQDTDGSIDIFGAPFPHDPPARRARRLRWKRKVAIPLSLVAHRLDAYRRLPHGWRPTPPGIWTDAYMWLQFLSEDWVRSSTVHAPTVIYLKRGDHPGLSSPERAAEAKRFAELYLRPGGTRAYEEAVTRALFTTRYQQWRTIRKLEKKVKAPWWKRLGG